MGDPFKVELYSVLVSVAVGFVAIFLFVFEFNLYETYLNKHLNVYAEQVFQESSGKQGGGSSNKKEDNKKTIELELQDLKDSMKNAMDVMKQHVLIVLFISIIIGEFFK